MKLQNLKEAVTGKFFGKSKISNKIELHFKNLRWLALAGLLTFVGLVLYLPSEETVEFSQMTSEQNPQSPQGSPSSSSTTAVSSSGAHHLWSAPANIQTSSTDSSARNTSMLIGGQGANAKTQIAPGQRMTVQITDKFVVSQENVPVLAVLVADQQTESGLTLPAGTRFYGEASYQSGAGRATLTFKTLSLPTGEMRKVNGLALSSDGQPGVAGHVFSDGMKNTAGEVLTTFVGGLASGSVQTDIFGRSAGGVKNGLLNAVSTTASNRAESFGDNLKTEREWIEVAAGTECDVVLQDSLNLQLGAQNE